MAQRPVHWTKFTGTDWYHTVEKRIDWLQNKVLAGERENNVLREQNAYLKDLVEQYSSTIRPCMQTESKCWAYRLCLFVGCANTGVSSSISASVVEHSESLSISVVAVCSRRSRRAGGRAAGGGISCIDALGAAGGSEDG